MPDRNDAPSKEKVEDLVRRAQQGHSEAFAGLYEAYYDKIYRYVMFKTGDSLEAEDLTEEVFLRMLESIGSFKWQGYPFTSWLFRIAHNLVIDYYRKSGRQKKTSLDDAMRVVGTDGVDIDRKLDVELSIKEVKDAMGGDATHATRSTFAAVPGGLCGRAETAEAYGQEGTPSKALQHAAIIEAPNAPRPRMEGLISQGVQG